MHIWYMQLWRGTVYAGCCCCHCVVGIGFTYEWKWSSVSYDSSLYRTFRYDSAPLSLFPLINSLLPLIKYAIITIRLIHLSYIGPFMHAGLHSYVCYRYSSRYSYRYWCTYSFARMYTRIQFARFSSYFFRTYLRASYAYIHYIYIYICVSFSSNKIY